jgi:glycosyltransferase involved in cell wall biosynthesis
MPRAPRLVLAGRTGITAEDYAFASRLGLADHLDVRQDLSGLDLQSVYQQAALFVLSSDEEGLGIVILEAMASGLPVISTNCGGPSMAITHGVNGLLTPVGDAKQLAEAMKQLLTQPEQRRVIGATGRSMVEATFSLDIAGRTYLDRYERLLAR